MSLPALVLLLVIPGPLASMARAQTVLDFEETLERTRPEAWAMAYFGSLFVLTRLAEPLVLEPGEWALGLEGGWVPSLSEEERRVGFDGLKVEDLNRTSLVGRLRGAVGLPGRLVLGMAWAPPIEVDGMEANVVSLGLGRSLSLGKSWELGLRGSLTTGEIRGDITCDRASVAAGEDPEANPFGCLEPSRDTMTLRSGTLEVTVVRTDAVDRWSLHSGLEVSYFDNVFEIRARYANVVDRTRLQAEHLSAGLTLGLVRRTGDRWRWAGELFFSPLQVDRGGATETDALLHARLHLSYRLP